MKRWKIAGLAALVAITMADSARAGDPIQIAREYTDAFKAMAADNRGKGNDFEAFCRMARNDFDLPYMIQNIRNWGGVRETASASDNLVLGYIVAYALNKQDFFKEARQSLASVGYIHVSTAPARIASVRNATLVKFKVRNSPDADVVELLVGPDDKVIEVGNSMGWLVKSAGGELSHGNPIYKMESDIEQFIGKRYVAGCP